MCPLFTGPKLKIERAKKHINDVEAEVSKFLSGDYYRLVSKRDPHTRKCAVEVKVIKPLPDRFPLIVGDAVHNLSCALDLAVSDAFFKTTGRRSDHIKFPFDRTEDRLINACDRGNIKQTSKHVRDFIVKVVKPYEGGNEPLCALHRLDIKDKHVLLLPLVVVGALTGLRVKDERGKSYGPLTILTVAGTVSFPYSMGNLKITNHGKAASEVVFDKGLPFEDQPIVPTLHQLAELVGSIVKQLERLA